MTVKIMDGSRWNGSSQPAVCRTSFASSTRHCCGSCAAEIAASADPLPYGLGSPDPRSLRPPPGVVGDATDAAEAGFSVRARVAGAKANPSWSRVGRGRVGGATPACEASDRLNGMLRRRVRLEPTIEPHRERPRVERWWCHKPVLRPPRSTSRGNLFRSGLGSSIGNGLA